MSNLIAIWADAGVLTQLMLVVLITIGIVKGIITIPGIHIGKKKPLTGSIQDHVNCPKFPSLKILVMDALEKSAEIQRILINGAISEQMTEADDVFTDVINILRVHYLKLFRIARDGDEIAGLLQEPEVMHYIALLNNTESLLKGMTRRFMKKNHFIDKSDEEFRHYVEGRIGDYQKALSQYLDEHYDTKYFTISREDLFESNISECMPEISKKLYSFFYRVRTIAQEKHVQVEKLRDEIKDFS